MNIAENMMGTIRRLTRNVKTSVLVVVDSFFHAISYFKDEAAWRSTHATAYERQSRMTSEAWTARAKLAWIGDCRCAVPIAYSFNPSAAVPAVRRTGSRSKLRSPRGQPRKVPTSRVNKQRYRWGWRGGARHAARGARGESHLRRFPRVSMPTTATDRLGVQGGAKAGAATLFTCRRGHVSRAMENCPLSVTRNCPLLG
jgi:hypothetical protein